MQILTCHRKWNIFHRKWNIFKWNKVQTHLPHMIWTCCLWITIPTLRWKVLYITGLSDIKLMNFWCGKKCILTWKKIFCKLPIMQLLMIFLVCLNWDLLKHIAIVFFFVFIFQQRERVASAMHRQETVDCLKKFNARRKLKVNVCLLCNTSGSLPACRSYYDHYVTSKETLKGLLLG